MLLLLFLFFSIIIVVIVETLVGVLTLDFPIAATIFDRTTVMQRTEIRVEVTLLHKPTHESDEETWQGQENTEIKLPNT